MRLPTFKNWLRKLRGNSQRLDSRPFRMKSVSRRGSRARRLESLESRCVFAANLTGQVFHDLDGDQIWEPDSPTLEPALGCWTVYLDNNQNGELDESEPRQLTSSDGAFAFSVAEDGQYVVNAVPNPSYDRTRPIQFGLSTRLEAGVVVDQVFDPVRDVLYSTNEDRIHRTKTDQSTELLTALGVGNGLSAIDVTPDGQFLLAGEGLTHSGEGRVYKIAVETGDVTTIPFTFAANEGGVVDLVVIDNHRALVTTRSTTGDLVPLREINLDTNTIAVRSEDFGAGAGMVQPDSRFQRDATRSVIVLAEAHDTSGPLRRYNPGTNTFGVVGNAGQSLDNAHLAISKDGNLVAVESADLGLKVFDANWQAVQSLTHLRGGVAFDSLRNILYVGDTSNDELVAFDTTNWSELYRVAVGEEMPDSGVYFEMQIDRNAKFLSVTSPSGVRWVALDRPVPYVVNVSAGQSISQLNFGFRWNGGNRRPTAVANSYQVDEDNALVVGISGVLGNDIDPDGGALQAQLVTGPAHGGLTLQTDGSFSYLPNGNYFGSDSFTYHAFDGEYQSCVPATVNVQVLPVNDPPTGITVNGSSVPENQTAGVVGEVIVVDADTDDQFFFQVSDGRFEIMNGYLRLRQFVMFDHEATPTVDVTITATDSGSNSISKTVTITITDVNEYDPTISTTDINVTEGSTTVGTIEVNDQDSSQTIDIFITGGNDAGIFSIDPNTGIISVVPGHELDHEGTQVYVLTISATDSVEPYRTTTSDVSVIVTDGNENSPVVQPAEWTILENSAIGSVVGSVVASDADPGQLLTYAILSGNGSGAFKIDSQSGEITVADTSPLDREQTAEFHLTVQATDNGLPTRSGSAEVIIRLANVNEFAPTAADVSVSLAENSAVDTVVATIVGHDADAVSQLSYTLASNPGGIFQIDSQTGVLTIASSTGLDAEASQQIEVTVTVADTLSPTLTTTAKVTIQVTDVNEFDPVIQDTSLQVPAGAESGYEVGDLSATDADVTHPFVFSILSGNDSGLFSIAPATGIISLAATMPEGLLGTEIVLTVSVSDGGNPARTDSADVTIQVAQGNQHAPVATDATWDVDENSANGTVVGTVSASDADAGSILTYSLVGSSGGFAINAGTGEISVDDVGVLDYESITQIVLTVSVKDNGLPSKSDEATITIRLRDVNEFSPTINAASLSVPENAAVGTIVGSVFAWDADIQQSVSYSVSGGLFSINANTGELKVASSSGLNYEAASTVEVTVTATDNGSPAKNSSKVFTIQVTDVNESVPVVPDRTFSVTEGIAMGTVLGTLTATDADASQTLKFHLVGGNAGGAFALNADTGELTVASPEFIDAETIPQFLLLVLVTDSGDPQLSGLGTVTINVLGINEAPLALVLDNTSVTELLPGVPVGLVSVVDPDAGDTHTFAVDDSRFEVSPNRILKLKSGVSLNYSEANQIPVKITATDSGGLKVSQTFVIHVIEISIPWQNPANPLDVNGDGTVSPSDVLQVINEINSPQISNQGNLPGQRPDGSGFPWYDVNGDGSVSPIDVLIIINELNEKSTELQSEGEGEAAGFDGGAADSFGLLPLSTAATSGSTNDVIPLFWIRDDSDELLEATLEAVADDVQSGWRG